MLTPTQFLYAIGSWLKPFTTIDFLLNFAFCFGPVIGIYLLGMFVICCVTKPKPKPKHFYIKATLLLIGSLISLYIGICSGVAVGLLK
jgi:hypothetical protein